MKALAILMIAIASAAGADGGDFSHADVVFLGERHDNAAHHARQAEIVADLSPTALVFEMLTPDQAALVTPALRADASALEAALGWEASGWPDFAMYHPIFTAAPDAAIHGAGIPREVLRASLDDGLAAAFGSEAASFGLLEPLPEAEQAAREALQQTAHCDAMPAEMLPVMVDIQRLRDARLAQAAMEALVAHGPPVAVITGNGHARTDWGAPAALARAASDVSVIALGQGEDDSPPGGAFDVLAFSAGVDRGDVCAAFR